MDSSINRGSFSDEEDDGLQHNRNEDIDFVIEKAIEGMKERNRFSSSNVGAANYIHFESDHQYGYVAATPEEIRLGPEVYVNDSDSPLRKDDIDNNEDEYSDIFGSDDISTEKVLDNLEKRGEYDHLPASYECNEELPPYNLNKYANIQNIRKNITVTNYPKNSENKSKYSKRLDITTYYESVGSAILGDQPCQLADDDDKMPKLENEKEVEISPIYVDRPPPKLTPENVVNEQVRRVVCPPQSTTKNVLNVRPRGAVRPPKFTPENVNEQAIGVVRPFNHENIDKKVRNISGVSILSNLNPPTELITRNRLRSHCLDSVKHESYRNVNGIVKKSDANKKVDIPQGISTGNHYRLPLTVQIHSVTTVPSKFDGDQEACDDATDKSYDPLNEFIPNKKSTVLDNSRNTHRSIVYNVKTDKVVHERKKDMRDNNSTNMSMPILLSPTIEENQITKKQSNNRGTYNKSDHKNMGRKQTRSTPILVRSSQRLPKELLTPSNNNKKDVTRRNEKPKHKTSLRASRIEPKETISSLKTFDNISTDQKTSTNSLDESVHSLDPFMKEIQLPSDILGDISTTDGQVATLEDDPLSTILKDLDSSKGGEIQQNENIENSGMFPFIVPETNFEKNGMEKLETSKNVKTNNKKVVGFLPISDAVILHCSKIKSIVSDNHINIMNKHKSSFTIVPEQKEYVDSKHLFSEIEKIDQICDKIFSDSCSENVSLSISEKNDSKDTKTANIVIKNSLLEGTSHVNPTLSHDCGNVSSNILDSCDKQLSYKDDDLLMHEKNHNQSEESCDHLNQIDENYSIELKNTLGTNINTTDASMNNNKLKSNSSKRGDNCGGYFENINDGTDCLANDCNRQEILSSEINNFLPATLSAAYNIAVNDSSPLEIQENLKIDLIKTNENYNESHVFNESRTEKINKHVAVSNIKQFSADSNSIKEEKIINDSLSKSLGNKNAVLNGKKSLSVLINKPSPLLNYSCDTSVTESKKDVACDDMMNFTDTTQLFENNKKTGSLELLSGNENSVNPTEQTFIEISNRQQCVKCFNTDKGIDKNSINADVNTLNENIEKTHDDVTVTTNLNGKEYANDPISSCNIIQTSKIWKTSKNPVHKDSVQQSVNVDKNSIKCTRKTFSENSEKQISLENANKTASRNGNRTNINEKIYTENNEKLFDAESGQQTVADVENVISIGKVFSENTDKSQSLESLSPTVKANKPVIDENNKKVTFAKNSMSTESLQQNPTVECNVESDINIREKYFTENPDKPLSLESTSLTDNANKPVNEENTNEISFTVNSISTESVQQNATVENDINICEKSFTENPMSKESVQQNPTVECYIERDINIREKPLTENLDKPQSQDSTSRTVKANKPIGEENTNEISFTKNLISTENLQQNAIVGCNVESDTNIREKSLTENPMCTESVQQNAIFESDINVREKSFTENPNKPQSLESTSPTVNATIPVSEENSENTNEVSFTVNLISTESVQKNATVGCNVESDINISEKSFTENSMSTEVLQENPTVQCNVESDINIKEKSFTENPDKPPNLESSSLIDNTVSEENSENTMRMEGVQQNAIVENSAEIDINIREKSFIENPDKPQSLDSISLTVSEENTIEISFTENLISTESCQQTAIVESDTNAREISYSENPDKPQSLESTSLIDNANKPVSEENCENSSEIISTENSMSIGVQQNTIVECSVESDINIREKSFIENPDKLLCLESTSPTVNANKPVCEENIENTNEISFTENLISAESVQQNTIFEYSVESDINNREKSFIQNPDKPQSLENTSLTFNDDNNTTKNYDIIPINILNVTIDDEKSENTNENSFAENIENPKSIECVQQSDLIECNVEIDMNVTENDDEVINVKISNCTASDEDSIINTTEKTFTNKIIPENIEKLQCLENVTNDTSVTENVDESNRMENVNQTVIEQNSEKPKDKTFPEIIKNLSDTESVQQHITAIENTNQPQSIGRGSLTNDINMTDNGIGSNIVENDNEAVLTDGNSTNDSEKTFNASVENPIDVESVQQPVTAVENGINIIEKTFPENIEKTQTLECGRQIVTNDINSTQNADKSNNLENASCDDENRAGSTEKTFTENAAIPFHIESEKQTSTNVENNLNFTRKTFTEDTDKSHSLESTSLTVNYSTSATKNTINMENANKPVSDDSENTNEITFTENSENPMSTESVQENATAECNVESKLNIVEKTFPENTHKTQSLVSISLTVNDNRNADKPINIENTNETLNDEKRENINDKPFTENTVKPQSPESGNVTSGNDINAEKPLTKNAVDIESIQETVVNDCYENKATVKTFTPNSEKPQSLESFQQGITGVESDINVTENTSTENTAKPLSPESGNVTSGNDINAEKPLTKNAVDIESIQETVVNDCYENKASVKTFTPNSEKPQSLESFQQGITGVESDINVTENTSTENTAKPQSPESGNVTSGNDINADKALTKNAVDIESIQETVVNDCYENKATVKTLTQNSEKPSLETVQHSVTVGEYDKNITEKTSTENTVKPQSLGSGDITSANDVNITENANPTKNDVDQSPIGICPESEKLKDSSDFSVDTNEPKAYTNLSSQVSSNPFEHQVSSQSGTVSNPIVQPLSGSTELRNFLLNDSTSKKDVQSGTLINKMSSDTKTENPSPDYSVADSSDGQDISKEEECTKINNSSELEIMGKKNRALSHLINHSDMASNNTEEELKPGSSENSLVILSLNSETDIERESSKTGSSFQHAATQCLESEIQKSEVTNPVELRSQSNSTFPDSTVPNLETLEDSENRKTSSSGQIKNENLGKTDVSIKHGGSVSNLIVANYSQSEKIRVSNRKDCAGDDTIDFRSTPKVSPENETKEYNIVSSSINQNYKTRNNNLKKIKHQDSISSDRNSTDEILKTKHVDSAHSEITQDLKQLYGLKNLTIVVEKIGLSSIGCVSNVENNDHKRKRQIFHHSKSVKRTSNALLLGEEEPPSKVLRLHANFSKSACDPSFIDNNNKAQGNINLKRNCKTLTRGKTDVKTDGNLCQISLLSLDRFSRIYECMHENKVKKAFIPSNLHHYFKKDVCRPSVYSDLEIIFTNSNERNSRYKRRRRKSSLSRTDDESDNENPSSKYRSERPRRLKKRTKQDMILNSFHSNSKDSPILSPINEKSTKGNSPSESSLIHERTVSSSIPDAYPSCKRHHESEISNMATPKRLNLNNKGYSSYNKSDTANYSTINKPIDAEIASCSSGHHGVLNVEGTMKEILLNVVRQRLSQAARPTENEEDSDEDFMGFEHESSCGCSLKDNKISQSCAGNCYIKRIKFKHHCLNRALKHEHELCSKRSSFVRNETFRTFRPSRQELSTRNHPRSNANTELHEEANINNVEVPNKDLILKQPNNRRIRKIARILKTKPSSATETDKNHEEDSSS